MSRRSSATVYPPEDDSLHNINSKKLQKNVTPPEIEVSWDGPDDLDNPQNFSIPRKWVTTLICALTTVNITFASSAPTSATIQIREQFNVEAELSYLITTLFLLGFVFGPIIWGPLSELLGRKIILVVSLLAYSLFIIGQAAAPNMQTLLITRFLSGFFSSSPLTNSGGVIADIWPAEHRAPAMSIFSASVFLGPVMGPIVGGAIVQTHTNWRWIFWVMFIFGMVSTAIVVLFLPETYGPVLLLRKTKRLRKQDTSNSVTYFSPLEKEDWSPKSLAQRTIFKPFKMLVREPALLLITIYMSLVYGLLYAQFEAFPLIFQGVHGFNGLETGLVFIGVGIGSTISAALNIYWNRNYAALVKEWRGFAPPEARLRSGMIGSPLLVVGIFWLGWSGAYKAVPWYVPAIASIVLGSSIAFVFISFLTYIVDAYAMNAASALAANTMVRSCVGAAFPLFIVPMYKNLGIQWASTLFGCLALLLLPSPFLFKKYGPRIRQKSTFAPGLDLEIAKTIRQEKEFAQPTPQNV